MAVPEHFDLAVNIRQALNHIWIHPEIPHLEEDPQELEACDVEKKLQESETLVTRLKEGINRLIDENVRCRNSDRLLRDHLCKWETRAFKAEDRCHALDLEMSSLDKLVTSLQLQAKSDLQKLDSFRDCNAFLLARLSLQGMT